MKQSLDNKLKSITQELSISRDNVYIIINCYLRYRKAEILHGSIVNFGNIVEIIPDPVINGSCDSIALIAKEISKNCRLTYGTVESVINSYLNIQKEEILKGNPIDFRGIVKVHPQINGSKLTSIHSSVSLVLTEDVKYSNKIKSVRVHTHKILKQKIKSLNILIKDVEEDDEEELDDLDKIFLIS